MQDMALVGLGMLRKGSDGRVAGRAGYRLGIGEASVLVRSPIAERAG